MSSHDEFGRLLKLAPGTVFSERERLIDGIGQFALGLEMGGLSGYIYNASPEASSDQSSWLQLRETIRLLELVGAERAATYLVSLLPRLESTMPDDGTWSGFLGARGIDLDSHVEAEDYDELFSLLDDYLHRSKS